MNLYDFDDTIYDGDTNKDIIKFFIKKFPFKVMRSLMKAKKLNKLYLKGEVEFERVKEVMLGFLFEIDNIEMYIKRFVNKNIKKIKPWYLKNKSDNDIIVSASYEIWLRPFCDKLKIKYLIATKTNSEGKIVGKNCKGVEKVNKIKYHLPNAKFVNSYSDSSSDIPMLELSKNAYVVEGNNLVKYYSGYNFKNNK